MVSPVPLTSLVTSQEYARLLYAQSIFHSFIRVQNISSEALVGGAMWGIAPSKEHRNKVQPVSISASLALRDPFESAAQSDQVNDSTVNYSTLSKQILKLVASRRPDLPHAEDFVGLSRDWSLFDLVEWLYIYLTGKAPSGHTPDHDETKRFVDGGCPCLADKSSAGHRPALLDSSKIRELEMKIFLPKATLLSGGVSLTTSSALGLPSDGVLSTPFKSILKVHDLRIPTLIGINDNERLARQLVVVNVEIDPYVRTGRDYYNELEQIIVKSTEESSFETLESLATHLSVRIIRYFVYPYGPQFDGRPFEGAEPTCQVRICLEKPCAVTFADAPAIEIVRSARLEDDRMAEGKLLQLASEADVFRPKVPFPLMGTLSEWIKNNVPAGST